MNNEKAPRPMWSAWLLEQVGKSIHVMYRDGASVSGVLSDFDGSHISLVSRRRTDNSLIPVLAALDDVRWIRAGQGG